MKRFKSFAATVAAFAWREPWLIVKFTLLFFAVTWFISRNFGGLRYGIPAAAIITLMSIVYREIFDSASDAFLDIRKDDNAEEKTEKTVAAIAKRVFYTMLDYGLAILSFGLVVAAKNLDFSYLGTVVALWIVIDLPSAVTFVSIYEKTGRDMTLGRSYRRMANVILANSKIAGVIVFIYETTLASFWSGPDYTVLFFRDELKTRFRMIIALLVITMIHALLWTAVYWSGYEDIIELLSSLKK